MIWRRKRHNPKPQIAPGTRLYAVGDIHGRLDLLDALIARINADIAAADPATICMVFLGDYVDRGPHSAQVLGRLIEVRERYGAVCLKGNHEAFLLDFLDAPRVLQNWGAWGGFTTLLSYGLAPSPQPTEADCARLAADLRSVMPAEHHAFLTSLDASFVKDDYFFVHAGIRPNVPLDEQTEDDLLWIRNEFLLHAGAHAKCIVHGHTPVAEPDMRANRINIDTGAYVTGKLTCLVLEDESRRFL